MYLDQILAVFGRLHPLLLHLPIGFLIAIAWLELVAVIRRNPSAAAPPALIILNAIAGALAVLTGLTLSREPGYEGQTLDLHKWLGISVGVGGIVIAVLDYYRRHRPTVGGGQSLYRVGMLATLALLLIGGHLGATITHGDDFIFAPLNGATGRVGRGAPESASATPQNDGTPTASNVAHILQTRCLACHGPSKQKGGLSVESLDTIMAGGRHGPMLVAGKPANSDILRRLRLPGDDDDHMPPPKRPQPTAAEIKLIEDWITAGAPLDKGARSSPIAASPADDSNPTNEDPADASPPTGPTVKPADAAAIAALQTALVHVSPLAADSPLLVIDFAAAQAKLSAAEIANLLKPLFANIDDLSLARCKLDDDLLNIVAKMPALRRLSLRGTELNDDQLKRLSGLPVLEELALAQTKITDAGLDSLAALPKLNRAYLWNTGVTADAAKAFMATHADRKLNLGDQLETESLETEPDITLVNNQPAPKAPASLKPVNTVCPVSGKPVEPKYLIVYDGKVIGFCCPNCPKDFWENPEKFVAGLK